VGIEKKEQAGTAFSSASESLTILRAHGGPPAKG
jgi:hypothetical protein